MSEGKNLGGRPTVYSEEIAVEICARIAAGKESLGKICRDKHMPVPSTVYLWSVKNWEGFHEMYTRARQVQATIYADEIIEISDDVEPEPGAVAKARLQVDSRKWTAAKNYPRHFGDRVAMEHTGRDGGPIETSVMTDEQVQERAAVLKNRLLASEPLKKNGNGNGNGKH